MPYDIDRQDPGPTGPVDLSGVEELRTALGDDELLVEILEAFLTDTPTRLETMCQAARDDDRLTVAREAHAIKGAAATLGLVELTASCDQLESTATGSDTVTTLRSVESARRCYGAASEALREYLTVLH